MGENTFRTIPKMIDLLLLTSCCGILKTLKLCCLRQETQLLGTAQENSRCSIRGSKCLRTFFLCCLRMNCLIAQHVCYPGISGGMTLCTVVSKLIADRDFFGGRINFLNFQLRIQNRAARRIDFPLQRQISGNFSRKSLITDTDFGPKTNQLYNNFGYNGILGACTASAVAFSGNEHYAQEFFRS